MAAILHLVKVNQVKNFKKIHSPLSSDILAQGSQPVNYSLTTPALYSPLYHITLDTSLLNTQNICQLWRKERMMN